MASEKIGISITEAAQLLGISRTKMYDIMRRKDFDCVFQIGTRRVISRSRLEEWVSRQCKNPV